MSIKDGPVLPANVDLLTEVDADNVSEVCKVRLYYFIS